MKRGWYENPQIESRCFHFKWTLKVEDIELCYNNLRQDQIVNHYVRNYELISKHGIARNMRALPSFEDADIDEVVPRSTIRINSGNS